MSGEELPESTLQLVQIYFDTATFDNIERDKKVKDDQLSIIGGTMGLLTGFSIISGFEILFFLIKLAASITGLNWCQKQIRYFIVSCVRKAYSHMLAKFS